MNGMKRDRVDWIDDGTDSMTFEGILLHAVGADGQFVEEFNSDTALDGSNGKSYSVREEAANSRLEFERGFSVEDDFGCYFGGSIVVVVWDLDVDDDESSTSCGYSDSKGIGRIHVHAEGFVREGNTEKGFFLFGGVPEVKL